MKVLHLLDTLNRGGAETLALDVCRNAARFGIDLTFAASGGGDLEEEFENSGADFIRLERSMPLDLDLVWKLRRLIQENQIEIVQGYQPVEALHLYLATIGLKDVYCVMSHQGYIDGRNNRLTARLLSPLMDANIVVGRGLFRWLRETIGLDTSKNFYLVYNGVDKERLTHNGGGAVRDEFDFDDSTLLLGMVANFWRGHRKDQMTICRALPVVFEKFEDASFMFVGKIAEGGEDYFEECVEYCDQKGIGEKVFFTGARDDVADILDSLDLFVFSSLHEGLPIAVIEAMLARVPVIVSDIEPLLEATKKGECAEVFPAQDAAGLAEKIIKLLKDESARKKSADAAYEFAAKNFTIDAHLKGLASLYTNFLMKHENREPAAKVRIISDSSAESSEEE